MGRELGLNIEDALDLAARSLSAARYCHTLGVAALAEDVAQRHGLDPAKARFAALVHDLAKEIPIEYQLRLARRWQILNYPEDEQAPAVLHGPLAAYWLKHYYGLKDEEVLAAVAHHTLGYPGMSPLEMLIYSADLLEPNRKFPHVDSLRQALYDNIEQGTLACVEHTLNYLNEGKRLIHPLTRLAHEDLQRRLKFGA
ncbi:bis(5'-nucleosyl)-tetraphosphatase (symmetrical) YqeK [Paradesulfitobacterium aromaticivorans]